MRNFVTYNLARAGGRYAARTVYVEVFVVQDGQPLGPQHYNGIYIALENIKRVSDGGSFLYVTIPIVCRIYPTFFFMMITTQTHTHIVLQDKNRVDIAKLAEDDPSGGYILVYSNDNIESNDYTIGPIPGWEHPFVLKEPNEPLDQGAYITKYLTDFDATLAAPDWLEKYTDLVDGPAWVDYFLLVELTKNPDSYVGSTYFYKDAGGPLAMGPAWDYNEAYGMWCLQIGFYIFVSVFAAVKCSVV
jgi:hypothetical protein